MSEIGKKKGNYLLLRIPLKKEFNFEHIYFKQYKAKSSHKKTNLIEIPENKALRAIKFTEEFTEEGIKQIFGLCGKISQIHIGETRNKSNNKRKR